MIHFVRLEGGTGIVFVLVTQNIGGGGGAPPPPVPISNTDQHSKVERGHVVFSRGVDGGVPMDQLSNKLFELGLFFLLALDQV